MTISSEHAEGADDANIGAAAPTDSSANTGDEDTHKERRMFGVFPRLHCRNGPHESHGNPGLFKYAKDSLKNLIGASDDHWRPRHQPMVGKDSSKHAGPTSRAA